MKSIRNVSLRSELRAPLSYGGNASNLGGTPVNAFRHAPSRSALHPPGMSKSNEPPWMPAVLSDDISAAVPVLQQRAR